MDKICQIKKKKDMLDSENQKQPLTDAFEYRCSRNFADFTGKYLCWSLFFNKVTGLQLYCKRLQHKVFSCEICKVFKNTFFYRTPPVAASGKSI